MPEIGQTQPDSAAAPVRPGANLGALWEPHTMRVDGQDFVVELEPRVVNLWEEAFATDSYTDEDREVYEQTRNRTRIEYVSERNTLHINLAFLPANLLLPDDIQLPVQRDDYATGGGFARGLVRFLDGSSQDILAFYSEETSGDDRDKIQQQRQERERRANARAERYAALPEYMVDAHWTTITIGGRLPIEIGQQGTRITQIVQAIQDYCRENDTVLFQWSGIWERVRELETVNNRRGTYKPRLRSEVFRGKHRLYDLMLSDEHGVTLDEDYRLKIRLTVR